MKIIVAITILLMSAFLFYVKAENWYWYSLGGLLTIYVILK